MPLQCEATLNASQQFFVARFRVPDSIFTSGCQCHSRLVIYQQQVDDNDGD